MSEDTWKYTEDTLVSLKEMSKQYFWKYSAIFCEAHWPVQCLSVRRDLKSGREGHNFLCLEYHHPIIRTKLDHPIVSMN